MENNKRNNILNILLRLYIIDCRHLQVDWTEKDIEPILDDIYTYNLGFELKTALGKKPVDFSKKYYPDTLYLEVQEKNYAGKLTGNINKYILKKRILNRYR